MFLNWYSKQYRSFSSSLSLWWQGLVILSVPPNKCHPRPQGVHKLHSQKKHLCFFSASSQRQMETKSFSIKSLLCLGLSLWPPSPTPPMVGKKRESSTGDSLLYCFIVNNTRKLRQPRCTSELSIVWKAPDTIHGVFFFLQVGVVCVFVWQDVILGWAQTGIAPKTVILFINTSRFTTLHRSKTFCWNPPSSKRWKSIFLLTFLMLSHIVSLSHDLSLTPYSARHFYKYRLSSVLAVIDQKPRTTSRLCGLGGWWERRDQSRLLRWHRLGEAEL